MKTKSFKLWDSNLLEYNMSSDHVREWVKEPPTDMTTTLSGLISI